MSQEKMEIARQVLDAFNRRDRGAWLELRDPNTECLPAREWPESDAIRGREAVWDFYLEAIGARDEGTFDENAELIEAGNDIVVAHVRGEMHGKTSGASVVHNHVGGEHVAQREGAAGRVVRRTQRGSPGCRGAGVGDVAGERGGRAADVGPVP